MGGGGAVVVGWECLRNGIAQDPQFSMMFCHCFAPPAHRRFKHIRCNLYAFVNVCMNQAALARENLTMGFEPMEFAAAAISKDSGGGAGEGTPPGEAGGPYCTGA